MDVATMPQPPVVPEGWRERFDVVVVDPPWAYNNFETVRALQSGGRGGQAEHHYRTIGSDGGTEINRRTGEGWENVVAAFPVDEVVRETAALFLWTTNPKLPFAFRVLEGWGFDYQTTITWVKVRKDGGVHRGGIGWYFRGATEHVLFGTRNGFRIPAELREANVVLARKSRHSVKPEEFYDLVERVVPDAERLDVFARRRRPGWEVWGDEVESL